MFLFGNIFISQKAFDSVILSVHNSIQWMSLFL